jgi:arginine decarboxylase
MDQGSVPYVDALREHAARDPGRLYVPGHKGGPGADPALLDGVGPRALEMDIPALIPGIDVGEEPTPFRLAQQLAAEAWGARRSWFLLNGASQGNHAACLALRHAGRKVVVQRNAHSSVVDGAVLAGLEPAFVAPELDPDLGVAHCVTADALAAALTSTPDAVGAICVSPTYFGACADVASLAEVAHSHGVPLVMDEAWGAHLRFSPALPASALESGADLVISSTHKIVGSLTQSAIVHLGETDLIDENVVDRVVTLLESTSPSSLLSLSLDAARRLAATQGEELLAETLESLRAARERIRSIEGLDVLDERLVSPGVAGWDPLRLTVDVRATGVTGHRCAALLREMADVYCELATETVVVGAFGMGGDTAPLADRFVDALELVVAGLGPHVPEHGVPFAVPPPWGPMEMVPRDAFLGPQEALPLADAVGRIASESLAAYPPGVPNVLPGERLTRETLDFIADTLEHGGYLRGASDRTVETIRVVVE